MLSTTKHIRSLTRSILFTALVCQPHTAQDTGQLLRLFGLFLLVVHTTGCFYIFMGTSFTDAQSLTKSWVWRQGVHPQQYPEGGFIYMSGIYETTLMLFGNGDATSNAEMGTSIMVLVSGAVLNALLFGKIAQIVAKINDSDIRKNRKMEMVHQQMKTLNVR